MATTVEAIARLTWVSVDSTGPGNASVQEGIAKQAAAINGQADAMAKMAAVSQGASEKELSFWDLKRQAANDARDALGEVALALSKEGEATQEGIGLAAEKKAAYDELAAAQKAASALIISDQEKELSFWELQKAALSQLKVAQGELNLAVAQGTGDYADLERSVGIAQARVDLLASAQAKVAEGFAAMVPAVTTFGTEVAAAGTRSTAAFNDLAGAISRGEANLDGLALRAQLARDEVEGLAAAQRDANAMLTPGVVGDPGVAGPIRTTAGAEFATALAAAQSRATEATNALAAAMERGDASLAIYEVEAKAAGDALVSLTEKQDLAAVSAGLSSKAAVEAGFAYNDLGQLVRVSAQGLTAWNASALLSTGNITLLGAAVAALTVIEFASFQHQMQVVQGNTGMTDQQIQKLTGTILTMGRQGPVPLDQIATAFRHASDEGYRGAQAADVVSAAYKGAVATGGNLADVTNTLAREMHNWGDSSEAATKQMGILLVGAQQGNQTLEQEVQSMSRFGPLAASIHMPLQDAISLVSEFTKATGSSATSQTWATNMVTHIVGPTKSAIAVLTELKAATGIDLQKQFEAFAKGEESFANVMASVKAATGGSADQAKEIMTIFGGIRGGTGAMQLVGGNGLETYNQILGKTTDGTKQLNEQAAAANDTLQYKFGQGVNIVKEGMIGLGVETNKTADDIGKLRDHAEKAHPGLFDMLGITDKLKMVGKIDLAGLIIGPAALPVVAGLTAYDAITGKTTESIKSQLSALKEQQTQYEALHKQYPQSIEYATVLNAIIVKEAQLHHDAAVAADKHRDALNKLGQEETMGGIALRLGVNDPKASAPSVATPNEVGKYASTVQSDFTGAANQLNYDRIKGTAPVFLKQDEEAYTKSLAALEKWNAGMTALQQPLSDFKAGLKSGSDATVIFSEANKRLSAAQDQAAVDIANYGHVLPQHQVALRSATDESNALARGLAIATAATANYAANLSYQKYGASQQGVSNSISELQHQSALIGENTALSSQQIAVEQARLTVAQETKQIELDQLKLEQVRGEHGSKAAIATAQATVNTDINHLGEGQVGLSNAKAAELQQQTNDHFALLEQTATNSIGQLQHQSAMIALNTSMTSEQKAVAQATLQVQIDQRQISLDQLKLQQVLATPHHTAADVAAATGQISVDTGKLQEDSATLNNAKAVNAATHETQEWTKQQQAAGVKATETMDALALGIKNGDPPAQIQKLTVAAINAANASTALGIAATKAAQDVALNSGPLSGRIAAAQQLVADATDKVGRKLYDLHHNIPDKLGSLSSLEDKAWAASQALNGLQNAANNAGKHVAPGDHPYTSTYNPAVSSVGMPSQPTPNLTSSAIAADIFLGDFGKATQEATDAFRAGTIDLKTYNGYISQIATATEAWDISIGDLAGAAGVAKTAFENGTGSLDTWVQLQNAANDKAQANQLAEDQKIGDTAGALAILTDEYHHGKASLADLTQGYKDNKAAVDAATAADQKFFANTGQYGALLTSRMAPDTQAETDASANLTIKYHDHIAVTQQDIDTTKNAIAATKAWTDAQWESTYASGSKGTQSQMLNSLVQPLISAQSQQASQDSAVANAKLAVIAANSALIVQGINAQTTALNDLGGELTADTGVGTAQFNIQLSRINDGVAVQQAIASDAATQKATLVSIAEDQLKGDAAKLGLDEQLLAAQRKVGQDQIAIAQLQMQMDQAVGQAQLRIAQDGVKTAHDKMAVDAANDAANAKVLNDQLKVAIDNQKLVMDTNTLQKDTIVVLDAINYSIGGVQDYVDQVNKDLGVISGDQTQMTKDQGILGGDQNSAAQIAAQGNYTLGQDAYQTTQDTSAATTLQQMYELQLAQKKAQEAGDSILVTAISAAISALQANTASNNGNTAGTDALIAALRDMLARNRGMAGATMRGATANAQMASLASQGRGTVSAH